MARAALAKNLKVSTSTLQRVVRQIADAGEIEPLETDIIGWARKVDEHGRRERRLEKLLTDDQLAEMRRRHAQGESGRELQAWVMRLGHNVGHVTILRFIEKR